MRSACTRFGDATTTDHDASRSAATRVTSGASSSPCLRPRAAVSSAARRSSREDSNAITARRASASGSSTRSIQAQASSDHAPNTSADAASWSGAHTRRLSARARACSPRISSSRRAASPRDAAVSSTTTRVPAGRYAHAGSIPSCKSGAIASTPKKSWPDSSASITWRARLLGVEVASASASTRTRRGSAVVTTVSRTGTTRSASSSRSVRCELGSKVRIRSISSPNHSMRTGWWVLGENTSSTPPRTAKPPGSSTTSTRAYPARTRPCSASAWPTSSPRRHVIARATKPARGRVRRVHARTLPTITRGGRSLTNAANTAKRVAARCASTARSPSGDVSSSGRTTIGASASAGARRPRKNATSVASRCAAASSTVTTASGPDAAAIAIHRARSDASAPMTRTGAPRTAASRVGPRAAKGENRSISVGRHPVGGRRVLGQGHRRDAKPPRGGGHRGGPSATLARCPAPGSRDCTAASRRAP